jgi:hypothetical protein
MPVISGLINQTVLLKTHIVVIYGIKVYLEETQNNFNTYFWFRLVIQSLAQVEIILSWRGV